ncbi:MAG: 3-deoxy-D-manno-octulosonic acid transferase [gamma proteobacterium symbiont of Phacoides pectinatus]
MRYLYTLIWYLLLPGYLLRLYWRSLRAPAYRDRLSERFGFADLRVCGVSIWIHSVSVGETQAAEPLVRQLLERYPGYPVVITTTTPTGAERVRTLFGDTVLHAYFPLDIPFAVDRFLERTRPAVLVMMETEIWPNLLLACRRRSIRTVLANARMSARSAAGYARFSGLSREVFAALDAVAAQTAPDAARFVALGACPERVRVTGSIKFDVRLPASLREQAEVLRRQWGGRAVWVAASTHEGEEAQVLEAHQRVLAAHPGALLVLVPRHPERFERVAALVKKTGLTLARRSSGTVVGGGTQVCLGDTMGELMVFLAAADAAFVGGSLVPTGGHNVLEPAALGLPVVFGPHMFNFSTISTMLLEEGAALEVGSAEALSEVIGGWLGDASERTRVGARGREMVAANRGAVQRLLEVLERQLVEY